MQEAAFPSVRQCTDVRVTPQTFDIRHAITKGKKEKQFRFDSLGMHFHFLRNLRTVCFFFLTIANVYNHRIVILTVITSQH